MFKVIFTVVALFVTACYNASSNGISDNRASLDNNQTNSCVLPHSWNWLKKTHIALPNTSDENCSPIARLRCYCLTLDNSSSPPSLAFGHCLYGCFVVDVPSDKLVFSEITPWSRNHVLCSIVKVYCVVSVLKVMDLLSTHSVSSVFHVAMNHSGLPSLATSSWPMVH